MKFKSSLIIALLFFLTGSQAQKIYSHGGKYGVTDTNGRIVTELKYDSVYITKQEKDEEGGNKFVITKKDHKYGIVLFPSDTLPIIIEPKFDTIFQYEDDYIVLNQMGKWGFITYNSTSKATDNLRMFSDYRINISKVFISEMEYDKIDRRYLYKDDKCGYLFKSTLDYLNGQSFSEYCIIPAIYDEFYYTKEDGVLVVGSYETGAELEIKYYTLFKVIKDGYVNYLSVNDRSAKESYKTHFSYDFKDDEVTYLEKGLFIINQIGKPLMLFNAVSSTYKNITDNEGKDLTLKHYFDFEVEDLTGTDSIAEINGVLKNETGKSTEKEYITIFINTKNGVSLIFKLNPDSERKSFVYQKIYGYNPAYFIAEKNHMVQAEPFTAFISKDTSYTADGVLMQAYSLITFPENKVVYQTTYKANDEYIIVNRPLSDKLVCCCPYFQIVKHVKTHNKYNEVKKRTLGYINYKSYEFSKKRSKGCKDDKNKWSDEMYYQSSPPRYWH